MLFSAAVVLFPAAAHGAVTGESAAAGIPAGEASGDDAEAHILETPGLLWSPDLQWRRGLSLRIPKDILAQAGEPAAPASAVPAPAARLEFGVDKSYLIPKELMGSE